MAEGILDPRTTFVDLRGYGDAVPVPVSEDFWPRLVSGEPLIEGRMVSAYDFSEDWQLWEMHPKGDELAVMLSGAATLILDQGGAERAVALDFGDLFIIPKGAWHRAVISSPCRMLFVTPGEGTEHRPLKAD